MAMFTKMAGEWVARWSANNEEHNVGDTIEVTKRNGSTTKVELLDVKYHNGYGIGIIENNRKSTRERKENKINKLNEWQEKAEDRADQAYQSVRGIADNIPFGQPILVGHYSEKMHRGMLAKIDSGMRKSVEESNKAVRHAEKATNIARQLDNSIYDDDVDVIEKLQDKLIKLEEQRTAYKEYNKKAKLEGREILPSYLLSNLGAVIRNTSKRIDRLTREQQLLAQ